MIRTAAILIALAFAIPALADLHEDRAQALLLRLPTADAEFLVKAKYAGHFSLWRLVTFSNHEGRFIASFHLPDALVKQFADPEPLIISLEGSPHLWSLHRRKSGTLDEGLSLIILTCYAADETWPFNRYALSSDGQMVTVIGGQMFGLPTARQSLTMTQNERTLRFTWRLQEDHFASRRLDVADLAQLTTRAPGMEEHYLMPILRRLGPGRPASDVYKVFDQIQADPKVIRQILPIITRLDSDDSVVRDAAAASLKAMGAPALLACMRLDPSILSPEQKNRLDAFCATDGWVHVPDIEAARHDGEFLTACLEDEDPAVRSSAANLLAALRTVQQLQH
jgi:hypothetical protein